MSDFRMPALGADREKGTLVKWLVSPGSHVKRGDVIADVETDKGTIAVEIWESGDVEKILVIPGQEVPVGTVLATIRSADAAAAPGPAAKLAAAPESVASEKQVPAEPALARATAALKSASSRSHVSPLARKLAASLGVDLARVQGTGPGGAITRADVEGAGRPAGASVVPGELSPAPATDKMRHAISLAMARSKREIPH